MNQLFTYSPFSKLVLLVVTLNLASVNLIPDLYGSLIGSMELYENEQAKDPSSEEEKSEEKKSEEKEDNQVQINWHRFALNRYNLLNRIIMTRYAPTYFHLEIPTPPPELLTSELI